MHVEKERFLLNETRKYMITGRISKEAEIECYIDGTRLPAEVNKITVMNAFMRSVETKNPGGKWVEVVISLPENLKQYKKLEVYAVSGKLRVSWYKMRTKELMKKQGKPQLFIDDESVLQEKGVVVITGWAVGTTSLTIKLYDENKQPLPVKLKKTTRMDVAEMFRECEVGKDCGFKLKAENVSGKKAYLVLKDANGKKAVYKVGISKSERLKEMVSVYAQKAAVSYRSNGIYTVITRLFTSSVR